MLFPVIFGQPEHPHLDVFAYRIVNTEPITTNEELWPSLKELQSFKPEASFLPFKHPPALAHQLQPTAHITPR